MSALAQPTRMEVFFALRDRAEGLSVGDLAKLVDTPPNTMSSHLSILARAGAVVASRSGRVVTYIAAPNAVSELSSFLSGGDLRL
ncbi:ArsR/SmtB family transcription factor [Sphingomonas sp. SORGH_AS_0870]|uniref:ArsR/SmtB family transcription factor n=1 Tax=Sphingomonas sp. SORGH_AS_0870 TaxID=3041801 RepID=UPI00386F368A